VSLILNYTEINRVKSLVNSTETEIGVSDLILDPIAEGWKASPTYQAYEYATSGAMDKGTMTAEDANIKFGLEGTPVAFGKGEMVSERHAKFIKSNYDDSQLAEMKKQEIEKRYGSVPSSVSSFVGNLVGGMLDPINLAMGMGASAAMKKLGMYTIESVSASAANKITREVARKEIAKAVGFAAVENLVVNTTTEYSFGKLHEYATNQEVSTKDRIFGIMAGTVLGTGIQGTMAGRSISKLIKRENIKASHINESYGDVGAKLVSDMQDHAIKSEANMVVFNPEYVKQRLDTHLYETRSHQTKYEFKELDDFTVAGTEFYKTVDDAHATEFGVGLSDNHNFVHNKATREGIVINPKNKLETYNMAKAAIFDKNAYLENVGMLTNAFKQELYTLDKNVDPKLLQLIDANAKYAEDFKDFVDFTREIMADSDMDINVDGTLANLLKTFGYDGVHMVMNKGEPNAHNMVFMMNNKHERVATSPLNKFNPDTEKHIVDKLKKLELEEYGRFNDPKQKIDYAEEVTKEADDLIAKTLDEDATIKQNLQDELELFDELDNALGDQTPVTKIEGEAPQVLDEVKGTMESLKTDDHINTAKALAGCLYKGK
jgi:hypothetical protein